MRRQGFLYGLAAYLLWGTFPLYFPLLDPASTIEVLACRFVFTALFCGLLLLGLRRLRAAVRLGRSAVLRLAVASVLIGANWGLYIWGVDHGHVVECSLGYFINPLVTVGLGVVVLRERLRRAQWSALAIGFAAVAVITVSYGQLPWLALCLAFSFGTYGLVKKQVGVPALDGLFVEAGLLTVPWVVVLVALNTTGNGTFAGHGAGHALLLTSAGVVTAVPLLFFAGSASRLPLSQLGLLQYLTPVLQLGVGVWIRHEPLPPAELAGFCLVWVALVVLSVDGWRHRSARTPAPPSPEQLDEPVLAA